MHATLPLLLAVAALVGSQPAPVAETPQPPPPAAAAGRSVQTFVVNPDGDQVRIEMRDGQVVKAERNGKALSDEEARALLREFNVEVRELAPRGGAGERQGADGRVMIWGPDDAPWVGRLAPPPGVVGRWFEGPDDAGAVRQPPKSVIGLSLTRPSPDLAGYLGLKAEEFSVILAVSEGSPADKVGLKAFDVVLSVNGEAAAESTVRRVIGALEPGSQIELRVQRAGVATEHSIKTVEPARVVARTGVIGLDDVRQPLRGQEQIRELMEALRGIEGVEVQQDLLKQNDALRRRLEAIAGDQETRLRWSSPRDSAEREALARTILGRLESIESRLNELLRRQGGVEPPKRAEPEQP